MSNNNNDLIEMRHIFLNEDLKLISSMKTVGHHLQDKQRETLIKNEDNIRNITKDSVFYRDKSVQSNSNGDCNRIYFLNSNLADDPVKQKINSANFVSETKTELSILYNSLNQVQRNNLRSFMITTSFRSVDAGSLWSVFRGERSSKSQRLLHSFKEMGKKFSDFIRDKFHVVGGVISYEIVVNEAKLRAHDPNSIFHIHLHLSTIVDHDIPIQHITLHNGKTLNFNRTIRDYWRQLCKEYDEKDGVHDKDIRIFDDQAFDIRKAYSKNSKGSFADSMTEQLKYPVKPDYLSTLKDMEDEEGNDSFNDGDDFPLNVFAELKGVMYRNPAKLRFGLLNSIHSAINSSGSLKSVIKSAMNSDSNFNISGRKNFGTVLTKTGKIVYASGDKEQPHWKKVNMHSMSDKEMLFQNGTNIAGSLLSDGQLAWLKEVVNDFDVTKLSSVKKEHFDKVLSVFDRLPYLTSVTDLTNWIDSVAKREAIEAMELNDDERDAYKYKMNTFKDLHRFSKAINKYTDDNGILRLGFHTSPNFKYKVSKWVSVYLGSVDNKFSRKRAWSYYASEHNGYKSNLDTFSRGERIEYRRAMEVADSMFGFGESVPQPREVASFNHIGCYFKVDVSHLCKSKKYPSDTGDLITEKDYSMLTAPSTDKDCWSEDGKKFDIDLYTDLDSFSDVAKSVRGIMKPFTKKIEYKLLFQMQSSTKKMSNA